MEMGRNSLGACGFSLPLLAPRLFAYRCLYAHERLFAVRPMFEIETAHRPNCAPGGGLGPGFV